MNVVIINDYAYVEGGVSQVALSNAMELAEQGCTVTLFAAVGPADSTLAHPRLRVVCTEQYDILRDPNRGRAVAQGLWNRKSSAMLSKLLADMRPEDTIIHVHSWTKAHSSSVIRVCLDRGFSVVCTMHDYFAVCPNGGFFNFQAQKTCTLKPMSAACICSNCDNRRMAHKQWRVLRQVIQHRFGDFPHGVKDFVAISDFSVKVIQPFLPPGSRLHRVGNPISIEKTEPVAVGGNRYVAAIGRIAPEKGPLLFGDAVRASRSEGLYIGDGELKEALHEVNPALTVTGWVSHDEVIARLRQSRVLVHASYYYETYGLAVHEAAAMGIPAIVSDTCAARDLVINGVTGLWFKGGDVQDLTRKIIMMKDDRRVHRMGRAAYERYWRNPARPADQAGRLRDVYEHILDSAAERIGTVCL